MDLRKIKPIPASDEACKVAQLLASFAGEYVGPPESAIVPLETLDALCRLIWFSGTNDPGLNNRRSLYISKPDVFDMAEAVRRAAPVVLDWPAGLHTWIKAHYCSTPGRTRIHEAYGDVLRRVRWALSGVELQPVMDEICTALASNSTSAPVRTTSFFARPNSDLPSVTGSQAARALGTTVGTLSDLIRNGAVAGECHKMGSRHLYLINAHLINRIKARRLEALTTEGVARRLGVSRHQVKQLRKAGILRTGTDLLAGMVERQVVDEFIGRLVGMSCGSSLTSDMVRVCDIPQLHCVTLSRVLLQIFNGQLPIYEDFGVEGPILGRFAVQRPELLQCCKGGDGLVSVRSAAARLKVAVRMIPALVQAGCLSANVSRTGTLSKVSVSSESVDAFKRDYVMAREIALAAGTSTTKVIKRLDAVGIIPIVASMPRLGISAVWRRDSIDPACWSRQPSGL